MNILDWLLGRRPALTPSQQERLRRWRALPEPSLAQPHLDGRFVVVDVETSGLDVYSDRLIAIGAVTVERSLIALERGFYRVLRQERASPHDNILVHGIGGTAQSEGDDPACVLVDFLEYIGKSPLVAFHAQFDAIMLRKAVRRTLGEPFRRTWLDLAYLAPAVDGAASDARGLDDWLRVYGIANFRRHDALADALATAQLLQVLASRASAAGVTHTAQLMERARSAEWLSKQAR